MAGSSKALFRITKAGYLWEYLCVGSTVMCACLKESAFFNACNAHFILSGGENNYVLQKW